MRKLRPRENAFIAKMGMRENAFTAKMGSCGNAILLRKEFKAIMTTLNDVILDLQIVPTKLSVDLIPHDQI